MCRQYHRKNTTDDAFVDGISGMKKRKIVCESLADKRFATIFINDFEIEYLYTI